MRSNLRSVLTFILGWPLSLIALYFLGKTFYSQFGKISSDLTHIQWLPLIISVALFTLYFYLRSYIWYKMYRYAGHELDVRDTLFQWSYAQLKRYIPGNIWAIVGVSVHFGKKNITKKEVAKSFVVESQLVLLAAPVVGLLGLPILLKALNLQSLQSVITLSMTIVFLLGIIVYFYIDALLKKFKKIPDVILYLFPTLKAIHLANLWLLMVVAFLCYGIGTYFAVTSLVYLDVTQFFSLSGYFVLSLLVGFLSFITPSGLGVREGAIALGLSQFIPTSLAAFAALFARLLLIVGEVIFIGIALLSDKLRKGRINSYILAFINHPHAVITTAMYAVFSWYFTFISFLRYEHFYAGRFDLGNMAQTVWNSLHGRLFEFTNPDGVTIISRMAYHADVILVLFAPFYALWQDPRMLLLLQALITGAGVFFVYKLAQQLLKSNTFALVFSFLYLINPSIQRAVIYDFHAVTLATTFLLGAFYFLYNKRYVWFVIFAVLAGITKEQIWAIIALFGLYVFFIQKQRALGVGIFASSVALVYLLLWHIIPSFSGSSHFALSYYTNGDAIDSPSSLIKSYLTSPGKLWTVLTDPARLSYLNKLFSPLGYLPLLAPLFLIFTLPDLTINILSAKSELYQIYYQYTAAISPFLFIAAICAVAFILKRFRFIPRIIIVIYLVAMGIWTSYLYGPLPGAKEANLDMITKPMPMKENIDQLLDNVPSEASVSTSNSLGSHLTKRKYLFTLPYGWDNADYIIFSRNERNAYPSYDAHMVQLDKLNNNPQYEKYYDDGVIVAFRKLHFSDRK